MNEARKGRLDRRRTAPHRSACGKVAYASRKRAAQAAERLRKQLRREGRAPYVEAYKCRDGGCHAWHVGHPVGLNSVPGDPLGRFPS